MVEEVIEDLLEELARGEHGAVVGTEQKRVVLVVWKGRWPWRKLSPSREECRR